jgi:hypothetical protein
MNRKRAADNPHMWIPYQGPEPYDESCGLCGTFGGGHHKRPDPPQAALPCREPWPQWEDEAQSRSFLTASPAAGSLRQMWQLKMTNAAKECVDVGTVFACDHPDECIPHSATRH